jgi:hypothetical protein
MDATARLLGSAALTDWIAIEPDVRALLAGALGSPVQNLELTPFAEGFSGLTKARVTGTIRGENFSYVVKAFEPRHAALWFADDQGSDPGLADREYRVYELLETLGAPHAPIVARSYAAPTQWTLVMADLARRYRILTADQPFARVDQDAVSRAYAALHHASRVAPSHMLTAATFLAAEQGSQVTPSSAERMWRSLRDLDIGSERLAEPDFRVACAALWRGRHRWRTEPRVLVFNDFYWGNVALPLAGDESALLFDWERAGRGFAQCDLHNFWTDRAVDRDQVIATYLTRSHALGSPLEEDHFRRLLPYAALCRACDDLWQLHRQVAADPTGALPAWMQRHGERLFAGDLARLAAEADV